MIESKAKKYVGKKEGVSPPMTEVRGIRNTYIL